MESRFPVNLTLLIYLTVKVSIFPARDFLRRHGCTVWFPRFDNGLIGSLTFSS